MRFAPSQHLLPAVATRQACRSVPTRAVAGVSGSKQGIEAIGACMMIAIFLAIAMLG